MCRPCHTNTRLDVHFMTKHYSHTVLYNAYTIVMKHKRLQSCFFSLLSVSLSLVGFIVRVQKLCFTQYFIRNDYRFLFVHFMWIWDSFFAFFSTFIYLQ